MNDLATELLLQGHEPVVIVPNDSLKKPWVREHFNNIPVYRLAASKTINIGYIRRAINEIIMPFTMLYGLRKSDFPVRSLDAVVWYSPSIFFGPLVQALKHSSKCPSYLILRDIFPEWTLDLGLMKKGPIYYLFKLIAQYQYSVADNIGVQSSSNLQYLSKWAKKPKNNLEVLNNWLSDSPNVGSSINIDETKLAGRKIFVYIGNMGIAQGMDILIDLATKLSTREDIGFIFVGRGTEVIRLKNIIIKNSLDNVLFYDEIDSREIAGLLSMCHVGMLALDPRHTTHNIPGKFLAYIQSGLPVLARINVETDLKKLIENERVGVVYEGNNIDEFVSQAEKLVYDDPTLKLMSKRGQALSEKMFSSSMAVTQIVSALNKMKYRDRH